MILVCKLSCQVTCIHGGDRIFESIFPLENVSIKGLHFFMTCLLYNSRNVSIEMNYVH